MKKKTKTLILLALFLIIMPIFDTNINVSGQTMDEYAVKSGFLYRICKFTQWPQPANPGKPFIISILGKTTPGKEIKIPEAETIDKRKIVIRKIRRLSEINDSEVLFITSSEAHRLDTILDYTGNKPILTVGDTKGFAQKGVIINFYIQNRGVRFEINYEASKKALLQMHSQLFTIGKVVKTKKIPKKRIEGQ